MSTDFDWFGDKDADAIVLGYQPPTAVYSDKAGAVIIRQKADEMEEYDSTIMLTPQGALAVAWRLLEEAHLVGLPEPSPSLMAEWAHWPPKTSRVVTEPPPGPLLAAMEDGTAPRKAAA